jgi:hypothetical protein
MAVFLERERERDLRNQLYKPQVGGHESKTPSFCQTWIFHTVALVILSNHVDLKYYPPIKFVLL